MAKVSTVSYTNETFKTYLMTLSKDIVWKNSSLAKSYEKNTDPYLVEIYITANRGVLNFDVVRSFPRAVLSKIGITELQIDECASDKNKIPENLRAAAVEEYQNALCSIDPTTGRHGYETPSGWVSVYEELNDYYRMLNGLPGINETKFVYNTDLRWDTTTPVHELSLISRLEMEEAGVLDKLIEANPDAEYLKYCGSKMISVYEARIANRFEILQRNTVDSTTLSDDFDAVYLSCSNLVNSVYYSDAFKKTNVLYENFLAMCILFMTIQTMQYHYLSVDVIRDFYDTESLKYVYDSYSVPFYNEIPLEYHRKIVKNINKLIGYKGSSQVFFDLFDIFNTNMSIYTYYLTKVHRFDEDGNPEFTIMTDEDGNAILDNNGNPVLSPSNYNIAFSRGEIYQDPALSVADPINRSEYEDIITQDPYWVEDYNVQKVIEDSNFNFNETKYIGVQTTFDLIKISYENAYIFKLIIDNRDATDSITLQWPDLGLNLSFFNAFIYLAAIVCKYHGYDGLISDKLPYTAAVLGYDFQKSATIIQDSIENNIYLRSNTELKELIRNMKITNANSVDTAFSNIQDIEKLLINGYVNSTTREEFEAYRDLYNTLMTSQIIDEVYKTSDGTIAESFSDLLKSQSTELYTRYLNLAEADIENEMTVVIDKLEETLLSLKYSPYSLGIDSSNIIENLFRIIRFFKSAKAEIIGYNVIYTMTTRGINFFRIMDEWVGYHYNVNITDDVYVYDFIKYIKTLLKFKADNMGVTDLNKFTDQTYFFTNEDRILWVNDMLKVMSQMYPTMEDITQYFDTIIKAHYNGFIRETQPNGDKLDMVDQYFPKGDPIYLTREIQEIIDDLIILTSPSYIILEAPLYDYLISVKEKLGNIVKLNISDLINSDDLYQILYGDFSDKLENAILNEINRLYSDLKFKEENILSDTLIFTEETKTENEIIYDEALMSLRNKISKYQYKHSDNIHTLINEVKRIIYQLFTDNAELLDELLIDQKISITSASMDDSNSSTKGMPGAIFEYIRSFKNIEPKKDSNAIQDFIYNSDGTPLI